MHHLILLLSFLIFSQTALATKRCEEMDSSAQANHCQHDLFFQKHTSKSPLKGTVLITHGVLEYSGRYLPFVEKLNQAGYNVYRYDLRGHGKSNGQRANIESFNIFVSDLDEMVKLVREREGKDSKLFLFGHSMGGLITFLYINDYSIQGIDGVVLSSPALNIPLNKIDKAMLKIAKYTPAAILSKMKTGKIFDAKEMTDDPIMQAQHKSDVKEGLIIKDTTNLLAYELIHASYDAQNFIKTYKKEEMPPLFFMQGNDDNKIVNGLQNLISARKITEENLIHEENGGKHELLNSREETRNRVTKKIVKFLNQL